MAATYSSLVGLAVGSKYEVRKVLGVGGMGVVCEAVHLDLGKKVAIKLIDKTMKESELIVARFRREARALGQIQSEHIVDVFDVGADARVGLYMVMEHLAGEDLQSRIERESRVDLTTGVMIAHQVARGLDKAHASGVIHRDLKPANVFLTSRDNGGLLVKLLDFGVSKLLGDAGGARITGSGAPIGTPLYMSPEQAEGKDDTDGRADIWSLGAVLYEALSGTPPFADRGSYHGTIVGILTSRPKLLHDAAPWVPPALAKVVDAMLVHDRDARIKDAATVTKRLLEAYPAVLPDGTGRHTAVIVPQTTAPVDAIGDTEIFTSAAFRDAVKSDKERTSGPPEEDSKRTVPDVTSYPGGAPNEATRTAAATPIDLGRSDAPPSDEVTSSPPAASGISTKSGEARARAASLPAASPSSSASGVAMPGTPPLMDPIPLSEIAPDTTRDDQLAVRAERRRWLGFALVATAVVAVAVGGYFAGRRAGPVASPAPPTTEPAPSASAAPATSAAPAEAPAPLPEPTAVTTPSALPSVNDPPSASAAPVRHTFRRKPKPAATAEDKPAEDTPAPPQNPYEDPK
ncbi:MAG: serine/threonine protein kinase [Labilithrix sp.]|nr:serine/threonine protein kinase [Labilithrix sp.]